MSEDLYPRYGNQDGTPGACVRDGDWEPIRFFEEEHKEIEGLGVPLDTPAESGDGSREGSEPCGHFGE
jgi:hypothetical protein